MGWIRVERMNAEHILTRCKSIYMDSGSGQTVNLNSCENILEIFIVVKLAVSCNEELEDIGVRVERSRLNGYALK